MFDPDRSSKLDNILKELKKRGYSVRECLGKGFTKTCFKVVYKAESGVALERVAKIPTTVTKTDSVGHLIYLSKERDANTDELRWYTQLDHHNIAKLLDSIKVTGQIVNFEEYFNAKSSRDIVKPEGTIPTPITSEEDFENIVSQVMDAVSYLHDNNVIHRDLKPSNILVNERGHVKLTDLQNAKRLDDVVDQCFATRGGAAYTSPDILNAVFTKEEVSASKKSDLYALGVSMYFILTGNLPFNYEFVLDEKGKSIEINGDLIVASLKKDGFPIDEIKTKEHETQLKESLKNIPRKYQKLIHSLLTLNHEKQYYSIGAVKNHFNKIKGPKRKFFIKDLLKGLKRGFYTAAAGLGISGFLWLMANTNFCSNDFRPPSPSEMFREMSLLGTKFSDINTKSEILNSLDLLYAQGKDRYKSLKIKDKTLVNNLEFYISRVGAIQRQNPRLASSLIRACYAVDKETLSELKNDTSRKGAVFVPSSYVKKFDFILDSRLEERSWGELMLAGMTYLKQAIGDDYDSVEEVYANYFCSDKEIFNARRAAGDVVSYFGEMRKGVFEPGYRLFLPKAKKKIIDLAVAFYKNTDEEGKLFPKKNSVSKEKSDFPR